MKLREWRKKKKLSQSALAEALVDFANKQNPIKPMRVFQNTIGYWERGTLPRRSWLVVIAEFTKGHVTAEDFISPHIESQEAQLGA